GPGWLADDHGRRGHMAIDHSSHQLAPGGAMIRFKCSVLAVLIAALGAGCLGSVTPPTAIPPTATLPAITAASADPTATVTVTAEPSPTTNATTVRPSATSAATGLLTATPIFTPAPPTQQAAAMPIYSPNKHYYLLFA